MSGRSLVLLVRGLACAAAVLIAVLAGSPATVADDPRPTIEISRLDGVPRLEDFLEMQPRGPVALQMTRVEGLIQQQPYDGEPASQSTHIFLGYDERNLYAVFVAFDDEPERIRANMARRENTFGDDIVEIMLDTFNDERRAYAFICNPFGVQWDAVWTEGQRGGGGPANFDQSFDTVWDSRGQLTDEGYVVWMAIPFKSLRFRDQTDQTWGVILVRDIPSNSNESSFWPRVTREIEGRLNQQATMTGLRDISPGRNIRLIPNVRGVSFAGLEPGTVELGDANTDLQAGFDGKFVFKDAVVLDVTANPDFSEVESDEPQVIVNQRFEVFFPERRPFFLENQNYFTTPINLVFTRRIVDPGIGGRLTGKLGKFTLGTLLVNDNSPPERLNDPTLFGEDALFGIVRLDRDIGEQSTVGMLVTARELGDGYNRVGGADARLKFNDHWTGRFQGVYSSTQEQDGTELAGRALEAVVERDSRTFTTHLHYFEREPEFRTQTGFVPRVDIRELHQQTSYRFWQEEDQALISWAPSLFWSVSRDYEGTRLDWSINAEGDWEFQHQNTLSVFLRHGHERIRPQDFPDLDEALDFPRRVAGLSFSTRTSATFSFNFGVSGGDGINFATAELLDGTRLPPTPANELAGNLGFDWRITRRLRTDNTYLLTRLGDPQDGGRLFRNQIVRSRWSYQFTQKLTLRAILQYDALRADPTRTNLETGRNINGDLLVTYLVNPFTAFFVGYNSNHAEATLANSELINTSRQLFFKVSYMFGL